ncbi:MAG TPA: cyclic nucleotide-binding domain-containing protein [Rectinemataceae bacterium]|nr:cyclic nucleotide-binding domain-containing protein [Rectinemataceae bacterium]
MNIDETELALLRQVGILRDLNEEEHDKVFAIARRVEFRTGDTIMKEGEQGETMYLFIKGEVDVTKNLTLKLGERDFAKAEKSMNKLSSAHASVFGEMSMFGPEPRSATITASSNCVLYEIRRERFVSLCDAEPRIGLSIVRRIAGVLCSRVRKGNEDVLKLSTALSIALSR